MIFHIRAYMEFHIVYYDYRNWQLAVICLSFAAHYVIPPRLCSKLLMR